MKQGTKIRRISAVLCTVSCSVALISVPGCGSVRMVQPAVRYVAIGDSATEGPSERDYPAALRDLLDEDSDAIANEGHGGDSAQEIREVLEELVDFGIFPNAEVLLYWGGGTDIVKFIREHDPFLLYSPAAADYPFADQLETELDGIQAAIEAALAAGREAGWSTYVATYFPIRSDIQSCDALLLPVIFPGQAVAANAYIARLNERIRAAAMNQGAVLVDIAASGSLGENPDHYEDCNHLSASGNRRAAEVFAEALSGVSANKLGR